jgi:NTE family protein
MSEPSRLTALSEQAALVARSRPEVAPSSEMARRVAPAANVPAGLPSRMARIGLVLAGGGGKGAYELGVVDYLADLGVGLTAIAGTSIGALNGAVLACAPSLRSGVERLAQFWDRFSTAVAADPRRDPGTVPDAGTLGAENTTEQLRRLGPRAAALRRCAPIVETLVAEAVDIEGIRHGLPLWVVAYPVIDPDDFPGPIRHALEALRRLVKERGQTFRLNDRPAEEVHHILLASAAIPWFFPARIIDGRYYHDGGLGGPRDNTPIHALRSRENCEIIVVVRLTQDVKLSTRKDARQFLRIDLHPSVPIAPGGPLGGLTGMLDFSPDRVAALRQLGYDDARARFDEIRRILEVNQNANQAHVLLVDRITQLRAARSTSPIDTKTDRGTFL